MASPIQIAPNQTICIPTPNSGGTTGGGGGFVCITAPPSDVGSGIPQEPNQVTSNLPPVSPTPPPPPAPSLPIRPQLRALSIDFPAKELQTWFLVASNYELTNTNYDPFDLRFITDDRHVRLDQDSTPVNLFSFGTKTYVIGGMSWEPYGPIDPFTGRPSLSRVRPPFYFLRWDSVTKNLDALEMPFTWNFNFSPTVGYLSTSQKPTVYIQDDWLCFSLRFIEVYDTNITNTGAGYEDLQLWPCPYTARFNLTSNYWEFIGQNTDLPLYDSRLAYANMAAPKLLTDYVISVMGDVKIDRQALYSAALMIYTEQSMLVEQIIAFLLADTMHLPNWSLMQYGEAYTYVSGGGVVRNAIYQIAEFARIIFSIDGEWQSWSDIRSIASLLRGANPNWDNLHKAVNSYWDSGDAPTPFADQAITGVNGGVDASRAHNFIDNVIKPNYQVARAAITASAEDVALAVSLSSASVAGRSLVRLDQLKENLTALNLPPELTQNVADYIICSSTGGIGVLTVNLAELQNNIKYYTTLHLQIADVITMMHNDLSLLGYNYATIKYILSLTVAAPTEWAEFATQTFIDLGEADYARSTGLSNILGLVQQSFETLGLNLAAVKEIFTAYRQLDFWGNTIGNLYSQINKEGVLPLTDSEQQTLIELVKQFINSTPVMLSSYPQLPQAFTCSVHSTRYPSSRKAKTCSTLEILALSQVLDVMIQSMELLRSTEDAKDASEGSVHSSVNRLVNFSV